MSVFMSHFKAYVFPKKKKLTGDGATHWPRFVKVRVEIGINCL
jgi:hypothetical protein